MRAPDPQYRTDPAKLPMTVDTRAPAARRRLVGTAAAALVAVAAACGGDSGPTGPGGLTGDGSITATVNGASWTSVGAMAMRSGGAVSIAGSTTSQTTLSFAFIDAGTGTYVIPTSIGLNFNFTDAAAGHGWIAHAATGQVGGSGTVTVTTLTDQRVAGTFSFTAVPVTATGATTTITVTNGAFDVRF